MLCVSLHPDGMAPRIANLAQWRAHILARLHRQADTTADPGWPSCTYRPLGKLIDTGATRGVPTCSWICAWALSGTSRGLPRYTWPL